MGKWDGIPEAIAQKLRRKRENRRRQFRARRTRLLRHLLSRTPFYPETGEIGTFAGFTGVMTKERELVNAVYRTESGCLFAEIRQENRSTSVIVNFDPQKNPLRTVEWFLGKEKRSNHV